MKFRTSIAVIAATAAATCFAATDALASTGPSTPPKVIVNKIPVAPLNLHAHTTPGDPYAAPGADWGFDLQTRGTTDGYVVDNVLLPGESTGWHSHPGPSLIFVIHGTVTNFTSEDPSCTGTAYGAGSSFVDAGGKDSHTLKNLGSETAETIAVQLLPHNAPRKTPADVPPNCG